MRADAEALARGLSANLELYRQKRMSDINKMISVLANMSPTVKIQGSLSLVKWKKN